MVTQDQRATLQLLLERGQSYADLAALLGEDEAAVRARARAALTELVGTDPDRNVGLTDYLLGQADPIGRADASRHLREDPEDSHLATELAVRLRLMFPTAELPRLPGEARQSGGLLRRGTPGKPAPTASGPGLGSRLGLGGLDESQSRLIVICATAAVLLIVVVLAITGAFSGGDESSASSDTTTSTTTTADDTDSQLQSVTLKPVGGGDASGTAVFGLATGDQPYVDLSIKGLDPAPNGQTYVAWLMLTDTKGYPLSPIVVNQDGSFQDRFSIPSAVLPVIARVRFVDVSIAPIKTIRQIVRDAIDNTELVINEPGTKILRGEIPAGGGQGGSGAQGDGG
jgi:hypothetical protein